MPEANASGPSRGLLRLSRERSCNDIALRKHIIDDAERRWARKLQGDAVAWQRPHLGAPTGFVSHGARSIPVEINTARRRITTGLVERRVGCGPRRLPGSY